uniref:Uncharacterized protein n=1 Tax=Oryza nivara TaxID=4536 RepID=A0A0E0IMZ2_ORYNI
MEEGDGVVMPSPAPTSPPSPPPPPPPPPRPSAPAATGGVAGRVGDSPSSPLESGPLLPASESELLRLPHLPDAGSRRRPRLAVDMSDAAGTNGRVIPFRGFSGRPRLSCHSASRKPAAAEGPPSPTPPSPGRGKGRHRRCQLAVAALLAASEPLHLPSLPNAALARGRGHHRRRQLAVAALLGGSGALHLAASEPLNLAASELLRLPSLPNAVAILGAPPTGAPFNPTIDLKANNTKMSAMEREEKGKRRNICEGAEAMFKLEAVLKEEEEDLLKQEEQLKQSLQELFEAHATVKARIDKVHTQVEKDEEELEKLRLVERQAMSRADKIRRDAEIAKANANEFEKKANQLQIIADIETEREQSAKKKEQAAHDRLRDASTARIVAIDHTKCINGRSKDIEDWTEAIEERQKRLEEEKNRCKRLISIFWALGIVHFCLFWVKFGLKKHEKELGSSVGWIEGFCYVLVLSLFVFCKSFIDTRLKFKPDRRAEWASVTLHALSRFIFEGILNTAMGECTGCTVALVVAHLCAFGVEVIGAMIFQLKFKIGSSFESFDSMEVGRKLLKGSTVDHALYLKVDWMHIYYSTLAPDEEEGY